MKRTSKIIFSEKSLSVQCPYSVCVSVSSRPVPKKVTEQENFTKQSCQIYFNSDNKILKPSKAELRTVTVPLMDAATN